MTYKVKCCICGTIHELKLDIRKFNKWNRGEGNIQDIFPELSPEDREMLISQICPKCWDEMFGGME